MSLCHISDAFLSFFGFKTFPLKTGVLLQKCFLVKSVALISESSHLKTKSQNSMNSKLYLTSLMVAILVPQEVRLRRASLLEQESLLDPRIHELKAAQPLPKHNGLFKIIGGEQVPPGGAPYQVALLRSGVFHCGGALIAPKRVLTAAHCVYG